MKVAAKFVNITREKINIWTAPNLRVSFNLIQKINRKHVLVEDDQTVTCVTVTTIKVN